MPEQEKSLTFSELAKQVLQTAKQPLSTNEIWQAAMQQGLVPLLQSNSKSPIHTLGAQLYSNIDKANTYLVTVGSRPIRFWLKSRPLPTAENEITPTETPTKNYSERDLHSLLVYFVDSFFKAKTRTIYHERSKKRGEKHNQWIHPDLVAFSLTTQKLQPAVAQLMQHSSVPLARLYSFELKLTLDYPTLRESFFQAVSNSSWAHEGYLVVDLRRLSQSFGIGVIQLNTENPVESEIKFPASKKDEIDWQTVNRIVEENTDFQEFIDSVTKSVKINHPTVDGFDKILSEHELDQYLIKHAMKSKP
jgi:uncharacterized protein